MTKFIELAKKCGIQYYLTPENTCEMHGNDRQIEKFAHAVISEVFDMKPSAFVVIDECGMHIYSSSIKQCCHDHINAALDDEELFDYAKTWKVESLYSIK